MTLSIPKRQSVLSSKIMKRELVMRHILLLTCGFFLTGCVGGAAKLQEVTLPQSPSCMAPVPVPKAKAGDDARLALKKSHAALGQANGRLVCSRNWYNGVRKSYSPSQ